MAEDQKADLETQKKKIDDELDALDQALQNNEIEQNQYEKEKEIKTKERLSIENKMSSLVQPKEKEKEIGGAEEAPTSNIVTEQDVGRRKKETVGRSKPKNPKVHSQSQKESKPFPENLRPLYDKMRDKARELAETALEESKKKREIKMVNVERLKEINKLEERRDQLHARKHAIENRLRDINVDLFELDLLSTEEDHMVSPQKEKDAYDRETLIGERETLQNSVRRCNEELRMIEEKLLKLKQQPMVQPDNVSILFENREELEKRLAIVEIMLIKAQEELDRVEWSLRRTEGRLAKMKQESENTKESRMKQTLETLEHYHLMRKVEKQSIQQLEAEKKKLEEQHQAMESERNRILQEKTDIDHEIEKTNYELSPFEKPFQQMLFWGTISAIVFIYIREFSQVG